MSTKTPYNGRYCKFVSASDDYSTVEAVTIYDERNVAITLGAKERLAIHTLVVQNGGTARLMTLFDDADAGGTLTDETEILWRGAMAANASAPMNYLTQPLLCGAGRAPKVLAAGASTGSSVTGTGEITR